MAGVVGESVDLGQKGGDEADDSQGEEDEQKDGPEDGVEIVNQATGVVGDEFFHPCLGLAGGSWVRYFVIFPVSD